MKKTIKRNLLYLLSFIPIKSIAFASIFASTLGISNGLSGDYEAEMMRRLEEGSLPDKYYDFIDTHGIESIEELYSPELQSHRNYLKNEFISDLYATQVGDYPVSGTRSDHRWP